MTINIQFSRLVDFCTSQIATERDAVINIAEKIVVAFFLFSGWYLDTNKHFRTIPVILLLYL